ncbi:hypothetical protein I79_005167 [Cricetulus griseus]|uniref:Uncharacterized protein n=1 Tax=Cricetulus griseus TaxID=10029 RepID=G3H4G6_CRIGR|nr:hypothetical protein I79_005167 [Cricetulus griseus]
MFLGAWKEMLVIVTEPGQTEVQGCTAAASFGIDCILEKTMSLLADPPALDSLDAFLPSSV